jgi:hypothetical protein
MWRVAWWARRSVGATAAFHHRNFRAMHRAPETLISMDSVFSTDAENTTLNEVEQHGLPAAPPARLGAEQQLLLQRCDRSLIAQAFEALFHPPKALIESKLFGHLPGRFSGAAPKG